MNAPLSVVIVGAGGQLGSALMASAPSYCLVNGLARRDLDVTDVNAIHDTLLAARPDVIINAAAYTAVDRAESEQTLAFAVNEIAVMEMSAVAREIGARFIHISTDFVFDGKRSTPYPPDAEPHPLNVYGESKLAGEERIQAQAHLDWLIVRTSWVYSATGSNFVKTMLRLMSERDELGVVSDQFGAPTLAASLANMIWKAVDVPAMHGIHHWTDAGTASWYDFADAIHEEAKAAGLLSRDVNVKPIRTRDYPTPARRPAWSVLETAGTVEALGLPRVHWRENLRSMLKELNT